MNRLLHTFIALSFTFSASCKDEEKKSEHPTFNDQEFLTLDKGTLIATNDVLTGQGSVIFNAPLGELDSAKNIFVRFSLADAGTLEVRSHTDNNLEHGIALIFSRTGSALTLALSSSGHVTDSHTLPDVDAANEVTVSIDIHNGETPAHIMVWRGSEVNPNADNALYNSREAHDHEHDHEHEGDDDHHHDHEEIKGSGAGTFWGLVLKQATVTSASVRGALGEH